MQTCSTCRHWVMWPNESWTPPGTYADWRDCGLAYSKDFGENPAVETSKAFATDDHASLMTAPKFGCVQWEAKA